MRAKWAQRMMAAMAIAGTFMGAGQAADFVAGFDDLPLMTALSEIPEAAVTFDTAAGRIVIAVAEAGALWARVRELTRDFAQGVIDGFSAATSRSGRAHRVELGTGDTSRDRGRTVGAVAGSVTVGAVRTAGCGAGGTLAICSGVRGLAPAEPCVSTWIVWPASSSA